MEKKITIIGFAMFFLLAITLNGFYVFGTTDTATCNVVEKERVTKKDSSKYLIFCEEEVFENTDNFFKLKFNSSDIYRDIKEGEEYEFEVYGWRIPFLSMHRNIIKLTNRRN